MPIQKNVIPRSGIPRRAPPPSSAILPHLDSLQQQQNESNNRFNRNPENYSKYPLPLRIQGLTKEYLTTNIFPPNNELYFIKLNDLCSSYFPYPKLLQLAQLTYGQDGEGIGNACFFVCIGTRTAYNSTLQLPATKRTNRSKSLYIEKSSSYEMLFVDFLKEMFDNNESDVLEKTFTRDDILTISLFYREHKKMPRSGKIFNYDYLIGVASFVIDTEPSCLLAWLGIVATFPCKKKPQCNVKDLLDNMRGALNIGTFLICTCQWLKSLSMDRWLPVVCQVFNEPRRGPLNFYKKLYFIRLLKNHDLIHSQYLRRRIHVIDDDEQLHWYALFQPLMYLTMYEVIDKTDQESFQLILERGIFFFLTQKLYPFTQDSMIEQMQKHFGSKLNDETTFIVTKSIPDKVFDIKEKNKWIRYETDNNNRVDQAQKIIATPLVIQSIFDGNDSPMISTISFPMDENKIHQTNYLYLLASKIFFGNASYYYIIRQFFYFVFRGLSKLKSTHGFFSEVMPTLVNIIITRTYANPDYGLKELLKINGLPDTIAEISDNKNSKILKMYYLKLLALYSESFLNEKFIGDECDIYFLKDFFNISLSFINLKTNDQSPVKVNYSRSWEIEINRNNDIVSQSIENIHTFIQYVSSLINVGHNYIPKTVWLARLYINDLYILKNFEDNEEKIHKLPSFLGGQIFSAPINHQPNLESAIIPITRTPTSIVQNKGVKLNFIIERVEDESSSAKMQKQIKLYYSYLKQRKWKGYSKLLDVKGGKINPRDKHFLTIGPLVEIADLSQARLDLDLLMPIFRILDPWQEVYNSGNFVIRDKYSFSELITFRKETWLDANAANAFIEYLNDPLSGLDSRVYILGTTEFNLMVQSPESIQRFVASLPKECSLLLIYLFTNNHYVVVEIEIPSNDHCNIILKLATTTGIPFENLIDNVRQANVDLLVYSLNSHLEIDYQEASDCIQQENSYDCGIYCLQRIYFWKKFYNPAALSSEYNYLKDTVTFRVFALGQILNYFRTELCPLVYYHNVHAYNTKIAFSATFQEMNKDQDSIDNVSAASNEKNNQDPDSIDKVSASNKKKNHDSDDINAAKELIHLASPEKFVDAAGTIQEVHTVPSENNNAVTEFKNQNTNTEGKNEEKSIENLASFIGDDRTPTDMTNVPLENIITIEKSQNEKAAEGTKTNVSSDTLQFTSELGSQQMESAARSENSKDLKPTQTTKRKSVSGKAVIIPTGYTNANEEAEIVESEEDEETIEEAEKDEATVEADNVNETIEDAQDQGQPPEDASETENDEKEESEVDNKEGQSEDTNEEENDGDGESEDDNNEGQSEDENDEEEESEYDKNDPDSISEDMTSTESNNKQTVARAIQYEVINKGTKRKGKIHFLRKPDSVGNTINELSDSKLPSSNEKFSSSKKGRLQISYKRKTHLKKDYMEGKRKKMIKSNLTTKPKQNSELPKIFEKRIYPPSIKKLKDGRHGMMFQMTLLKLIFLMKIQITLLIKNYLQILKMK